MAPIALECERTSGGQCDPWPIDGSTVTFQFRNGNPISFGPFRLPGISASNFAAYLACDPYGTTGTCVAAPSTFTSLSMSSNQLRNALRSVGSSPRLVAVYDTYGSSQFDVVGWAAFSITGVTTSGARRNRTITLRGTFQRLFLDSAGLDSERERRRPVRLRRSSRGTHGIRS